MTEALFAIGIFGLAALGIGVGLLFGRGPARTSCGATDTLPAARCRDCPLRRRTKEKQ